MKKHAIFHQPESQYAYAPTDDSLRILLRVAAGEKFDRVELLYNNKYEFTQRRAAVQMTKWVAGAEFDYYRADLRLTDVRFAYIFRIAEGDRIYYVSEEGVSETYDFELAYYTFFQFPYINRADVMHVVPWTEHAVFYQIFVDRFYRGDYEKDGSYITQDWDGICDRHSFAGGDLKGIAQKLDYLAGMGFTALYLTPIFLSGSNHKYNIRDYCRVDPQFGTAEDTQALLEGAHERGMRVIIDAVFNHCDIGHAYFLDVQEKGKNSKYYDWFLIEGDFPEREKGNYAHFANCKYMPKWNTSNPRVRQYLTGIALGYLKMGFDGLRLDVADEVSHEMWRELRRAVKKDYPEALILGEVWHENTPWLHGDQMDGVMNYKLQKILVDLFGMYPISAEQAADRLNALLLMNTEQANAMALNFLDNHDTPRFFRFTGGNKQKLLNALCALVMFPGMPCVFYGTELPLDGGGDPDCRRTFDWLFRGQEQDYFDRFQAILALKKQRALAGGYAEKIEARNHLLVIVRRREEERLTAYFNTGARARRLAVTGEILYAANYNDGQLGKNGALVIKENI